MIVRPAIGCRICNYSQKVLVRPLGRSHLIKRSRVRFSVLLCNFCLVENYSMVSMNLVFLCPVSMLCPVLSSEEITAACWPQVMGSPPIVSLFLCVIHSSFIYHQKLAYKSLVTVELNIYLKVTSLISRSDNLVLSRYGLL